VEDKMSYIVYETRNKINGKVYIGIHNNTNEKYLGSGKYLNEAIKYYGSDSFERKILYENLTKEEAQKIEASIVNEEFIMREDTYNIVLGGGAPPVGASRGCKRPDASEKMKNNNPNRLPHVRQMNRTTCVVKDKNGNCFRLPKNDPRIISGEMVSINKNMVLARNKNNEYFRVAKDDPRLISGELLHGTKNEKLTCDVCGKSGGSSMRRWHFKNCRKRATND
jgi:hypothetical protein